MKQLFLNDGFGGAAGLGAPTTALSKLGQRLETLDLPGLFFVTCITFKCVNLS
jgi:hypothetical protein